MTMDISEQLMNDLGWTDSKSPYKIDKGIYSKKCGINNYWLDLRDLDSVSLNYDMEGVMTMFPLYKFTGQKFKDDIQTIKDMMMQYDICGWMADVL